jgi:hypothetical protein
MKCRAIFIAPLQAHNIIYVACTSGLVTAVSLEVTQDIIAVLILEEKIFFLSMGVSLAKLGNTKQKI